MLVMVKFEIKGVPPLPPEQRWELAVKTWETMISHKQQGKILAGGALASGKGCCEIYNVNSIDEFYTLQHQVPLFPFVECEIVPLTTYELALETAKQLLASARASK